MGRLHTRYSPVRRSPTRCCHLSLPLDLHVLSLSLAFILSQDQTLRCWNCFLISSARIPSIHRSPRSSSLTVLSSIYSIPILVLLVVLCKYPQRSSRYRSTTCRCFLDCGCKGSVIKHNYQTYSQLFSKYFSRGLTESSLSHSNQGD